MAAIGFKKALYMYCLRMEVICDKLFQNCLHI
jgi:hypothetical protein